MKMREKKMNWIKICSLTAFLGFFAPAFAQDEAVDPAMEPLPPGQELPAIVTPWTRLGEGYAEGLLDVLVPLFHDEEDGILVFTNFRTAYSDRSEQEINLGLGVRKHVESLKGILGANLFYDSRWTARDSQFNQLGVGAEYLSSWFDARANGYWPENTREHVATESQTYLESSSTKVSYSTYAQANTVYGLERRSTVNRFVTDSYKIYEVPLEGYDLELGLRIPLALEWLEMRLFGGYYAFSPVWEGNLDDDNDIKGFKGRAEFRIRETLFLDAELFEDDRLFGSDYLVSARLRLPFDISAIARGENPFRDRAADASSPRSRLTEMVMRDPHIQIRQETSLISSRTEETLVTRRADPVLENVIFVDGDNAADPAQNGTAENPFDLIQKGVDKSAATDMPNVFVFGASNPYFENVNVSESINLIGGNTLFANGLPLGNGTAPVVRSARAAPFLFTFDGPETVFFSGFVLDGATTPGSGVPLVGGAEFRDVQEVLFTQNILRDLAVGVLGTYTGIADYYVEILENTFQNNGIAIGGLLSSTGEFNVFGNNIENAIVGVGVLSLNTADRAHTYIEGNTIVSLQPVDAAAFEAFGSLLGALPVLPLADELFLLEDDEMLLPDEMPLPMIGGIVAGAIGGKLTAFIADNTVDGALLGITGLSLNMGAPRSDLDLSVIANTVHGGGLADTLDLVLNSGILDGLDLGLGLLPLDPDFALPFDAGLSGIAAIAIGDGARINDAVIAENTVTDNFLGITLASAMNGVARRGFIAENTLTDNLLGITAIGLLGGNLNELTINDNVVDGGGLRKLVPLVEEFLGPIPFPVPDFTLAGITLIGFDAPGMNDIFITDNVVQDHVLGVSALAFGETNMRDLFVADNTLENNFSGVLLYGLGENVVMTRALITGNTVSGAGTIFAVNLLGAFLETEPVDSSDTGLSGILVAGVNGARMSNFEVSDNTVRNQLLGVTAFSYGDANLRNGLITDNTVEYGVAGVLGASLLDGNLNNLTVSDNSLTGVGLGFPDGLPLGPIILTGDKATAGVALLVFDARARNAIISGNEISNNQTGILIIENGGNINGLDTSDNIHSGNDTDEALNP